MTHPVLRFIIFFILVFCLLVFAYLQIPDDYLRLVIYPVFVVDPSLFLLNKITALSHAHSLNNLIFVGDKSLEIVRGCDGSGFLFIFIAAVMAYPVHWRFKLLGFALGVVVLWSINILRISGLIYLKQNFDGYFYLMHNLVLPIFFCFISFSLFFVWLVRAERSTRSTPTNEK